VERESGERESGERVCVERERVDEREKKKGEITDQSNNDIDKTRERESLVKREGER
jgi:hypothetical protein